MWTDTCYSSINDLNLALDGQSKTIMFKDFSVADHAEGFSKELISSTQPSFLELLFSLCEAELHLVAFRLDVWGMWWEVGLSPLQVLQYLLDDVVNFISTQSTAAGYGNEKEERGCLNILKAFVDFISKREREIFRSRRHDNENSVALSTIHQVSSLSFQWIIFFNFI